MGSRVHEARINVSKFLQRKEISGMLSVSKHKGCGAVEGHATRSPVADSVRDISVRFVASMKADGIEAGVIFVLLI